MVLIASLLDTQYLGLDLGRSPNVHHLFWGRLRFLNPNDYKNVIHCLPAWHWVFAVGVQGKDYLMTPERGTTDAHHTFRGGSKCIGKFCTQCVSSVIRKPSSKVATKQPGPLTSYLTHTLSPKSFPKQRSSVHMLIIWA